jgi:hypothetical protein
MGIADREIKMRIRLGRHLISGRTDRSRTFRDTDVEIPPDLAPSDLDFEKSRPRNS